MSAKTIFARSSVAGLAIAAFVAMPAMAADVIYQEPPAPAAPPMTFDPVSTWAGPYAGISAGYGFGGRTDLDIVPGTDISTSGWMGGVFGGYNFQQGMAVYGIEGDVNYSRLDGDNAGFDSRTSLDGSLRGRVGAAVTDDILIYGTAGVAAERQRITNPAGARDSNMMIGYTVGAGTDVKLTDQVFGRLEYRYTDYGSKSFDSLGGADADTRNNRVSVGLGVKF